MKFFALDSVRQDLAAGGDRYLEFLRSDALSVGVYQLPAGAADLQQPHQEDEVYYVVAGRAKMEVGADRVPAIPGSVIFIPAREPHRFIEIESELTVLVFFAPPPESSAETSSDRESDRK